ncbi:peptidoglycan-binding protein [Streptomyces sp. NPDC004520]|uniref:peptidoglycan-binding domain-containing protein n=1 Tax=Streptomyces sp. NPDC004520 TaxID=3364702 RepID=UPI0036A53384
MPAAAGTAGEEIAVVRPLTAPAAAPAARTGRVAQLTIAFLALLVALLLGRWAVMNDSSKDDTATPPATTETQSGDSSNADGDQPPADTSPPTDEPTTDDGKAEDLQADAPATPGDNDSPAPGTPPTGNGNGTAPPARQTPSDGTDSTPPATPTTPAASPTRTAPAPTAAPTTSPASLGAEGRTACAHYRPNRRVILAKGMVGTNVAQVQCLLNHNYDYHLDEDGVFGADTEAGVKAVQRCSGITADGQVGPDTWKYLDYPKPACGH